MTVAGAGMGGLREGFAFFEYILLPGTVEMHVC